MKEVYVLGASGHAKVVISTVQAAGMRVLGLFDDREETWNQTVLGCPVMGPTQQLAKQQGAPAVIGIGSNRVRKLLAAKFDLQWISVIHTSAWVHPEVPIGDGSVVFAGAMVQPGASIGAHVVVNTACSVDHDCTLEDFVQVAPGAHLGGNVHVEEGAFVGIGASVIQGRRIGSWTTIGAGATVVHDLPADCTAVGVPARPR